MSGKDTFTVPVFYFENGKKIQNGVIFAEYLKDQFGTSVINPETQMPYIVPVGYKLENTLQEYVSKGPKGVFDL
jgi:hypothetical protein